jgi:hypothetical protein
MLAGWSPLSPESTTSEERADRLSAGVDVREEVVERGGDGAGAHRACGDEGDADDDGDRTVSSLSLWAKAAVVLNMMRSPRLSSWSLISARFRAEDQRASPNRFMRSRTVSAVGSVSSSTVAVGQEQHPVAVGRGDGVVGDHHDGLAHLLARRCA